MPAPRGRPVVLSDRRTTLWSPFAASCEPFGDRPGLILDLEVEIDSWGRPRCVGFQVRAEKGGALSWKEVRRLPLDRLATEAAQVVAENLVHEGEGAFSFGPSPRQQAAGRKRVAEQARRQPNARRRPKLSDSFLRKVARVYRDALNDDDPRIRRAPTVYVAEKLGGGPHTGYASAKLWVQRARQAGYLPPTTPGRKAG
jgi:hypothetical protein